MPIIVRRAFIPQDYPAIASVLTDECPQWPTTVQDLAHQERGADSSLPHMTFVAELVGEDERIHLFEICNHMIGVAKVGPDRLSHRQDKFKMDIRVRPSLQGHGAGKLLYETVIEHLKAFIPYDLYTEVWANHPRAVRFVSERGFVESWRRVDWMLSTSTFDFTPYSDLEERMRSLRIQIKTYAELASDPARLTKLYTLDQALWQDIPYGEPVNRSVQQFEQDEVLLPTFLPDACFIAIHENDYIGYCNLTQSGEDYDINMTGVLVAYRGKGLATLLKLYSIRYAKEHSRDLWTVNDSINIPIQAHNEKLGFQRQGATLRFVKQVVM